MGVKRASTLLLQGCYIIHITQHRKTTFGYSVYLIQRLLKKEWGGSTVEYELFLLQVKI